MDTLPDKPLDTPSSAAPPPPDTSPLSQTSSAVAASTVPAIQPLAEFLAQSSRLSPAPPAPPLYAPNRVLPRFIRLLALYVFLIGGTLGAATAWFYQSILYPRLVQRLKMLTQLYQHGLVSYNSLATSLDHLACAKGFALISPPTPKQDTSTGSAELSPAQSPVGEDEPDEKSPLLDGDELASTTAAEEATTPPIVAPTILAPLRDSLRHLATTITSSTISLANAQPTSLSSSLSTLASYIDSQNAVSTSMAYRPYIGYSSAGTPTIGRGLSQEQVELKEVVTGLKAEIRTVKGALLNRRNFAALPARAEVVA